MSTPLQRTIETAHTAPTTDAGYNWYLDNREELIRIDQSTELRRTLEQLELQELLPEGTALRFHHLYEKASAIPEQDEQLYAATWDAYHKALDNDHALASLSRAFANLQTIPLYHRIDATGPFVF